MDATYIIKVGDTLRRSGGKDTYKITRVDSIYAYWSEKNKTERLFGSLNTDGTPGGWASNFDLIASDNSEALPNKASIAVGCYCELCKDFASHASSNRPNGTFICYSCRSGWIPKGL